MEKEAPAFYQRGDLMIHFATRTVSMKGEKIDLTGKQYDVIAYLARNGGRAHAQWQIIEAIYPENVRPSNKVIDVFIFHARRKLGLNADNALVLGIKGRGYKMPVSKMPETTLNALKTL